MQGLPFLSSKSFRFKKTIEAGMVAHAFNPGAQEGEVSLRPARATPEKNNGEV